MRWPASAKIFLKADGSVLGAGDHLVQTDRRSVERFISWHLLLIGPNGPNRGQRVKLSPNERQTICRLYDGPAGIEATEVVVPGTLASYLSLFHICGPEAVDGVTPEISLCSAARQFLGR